MKHESWKFFVVNLELFSRDWKLIFYSFFPFHSQIDMNFRQITFTRYMVLQRSRISLDQMVARHPPRRTSSGPWRSSLWSATTITRMTHEPPSVISWIKCSKKVSTTTITIKLICRVLSLIRKNIRHFCLIMSLGYWLKHLFESN